MSWTQNVPCVKHVVHCSPSVKPFHFLFLHPPPPLPPGGSPTRCCCHSPYLLLHISTPLSCTGLMTVWYLSRVPSVPWYALLCHCCCLVSLSLFLLLLHPGSQPTLTYVSASYVLISNLTMLLTLTTSSPELFVTLLDKPKHPLPLPQSFVSLSPPVLHGRTSWDRSTAHLERSWARLPAAWRNLSGECDLRPAPKCPPDTYWCVTSRRFILPIFDMFISSITSSHNCWNVSNGLCMCLISVCIKTGHRYGKNTNKMYGCGLKKTQGLSDMGI